MPGSVQPLPRRSMSPPETKPMVAKATTVRPGQ
jgi:hypothetical protein